MNGSKFGDLKHLESTPRKLQYIKDPQFRLLKTFNFLTFQVLSFTHSGNNHKSPFPIDHRHFLTVAILKFIDIYFLLLIK